MTEYQQELLVELMKCFDGLINEAEADEQFNKIVANLKIFNCSIDEAYGRIDELINE